MPALPKSKLSASIREANSNGRLGLIVYIIPGFPSLSAYQEIMAFLDARPSVSIIENAVPVAHGHETANETIIQAHLIGLQNVQDPQMFKSLLGGPTPRFTVLYRESLSSLTFEQFLKEFSGCIDAIVPEWRPTDTSSYAAICRRSGVEFVQAVSPARSHQVNKIKAQSANPDGMVYLSCSSRTGGEMASSEEIHQCAVRAKQHQPGISLAAGMGVKTPEDIRRIAAIEGVDAVVLGTAFLQALGRGIKAAEGFVVEVEDALFRPAGLR